MFKLIQCNELSSTEEYTIETGEVSLRPVAKYLYDKEDPTDKKRRIRFGKYFETELLCRFVVSPDEFSTIVDFLNSSSLVNDPDSGLGLYLWFTDKNDTVHGYPVYDIAELPESSEDSRFYNASYEMTLSSVYTANPHLPAFLNYGFGNYGDENFGY